MTTTRANDRLSSPISFDIDGETLTVCWFENELRVKISNILAKYDVAPIFIDQLFSRWLVNDWHSLSEEEEIFLEDIFAIAEIDLKFNRGPGGDTISGQEILKLLKK